MSGPGAARCIYFGKKHPWSGGEGEVCGEGHCSTNRGINTLMPTLTQIGYFLENMGSNHDQNTQLVC